jgi:hypothetical protein
MSLGDTAPALATGGFTNAPAISIANDVIQAIINGGPNAEPYNWKWNRFNVTPFCTNSYQQDYFIPGLVNLGWLENASASNINQTSIPKQRIPELEVRKDLDITYMQTGVPDKICWLPNDLLQAGTWGQFPLGQQLEVQGTGFGQSFGQYFGGASTTLGPGVSGLQNPGPYVVYTNPIGQVQAPQNPVTAIKDGNGNLWVLTTYGVCGPAEPVWPTTITYPTPACPTAAATTVQDGTCVWTAVNPKGQGIRLNPIPPATGVVWLIEAIGQLRAPRFKNVGQTLEPIPDDYSNYFKDGFIAECFRRSPDPKIRAKYTMERQIWLASLDKAVRQANREQDDYGFYPGTNIMDNSMMFVKPTPAYPFGPIG